MIINMDDNDSEDFRKFIEENWGQKFNDRGELIGTVKPHPSNK